MSLRARARSLAVGMGRINSARRLKAAQPPTSTNLENGRRRYVAAAIRLALDLQSCGIQHSQLQHVASRRCTSPAFSIPPRLTATFATYLINCPRHSPPLTHAPRLSQPGTAMARPRLGSTTEASQSCPETTAPLETTTDGATEAARPDPQPAARPRLGGQAGAAARSVAALRRQARTFLQSFSARSLTAISSRNDGSTNPGNNLHVSGLSSRVDNRSLEELFAKYGRVRATCYTSDPTHPLT